MLTGERCPAWRCRGRTGPSEHLLCNVLGVSMLAERAGHAACCVCRVCRVCASCCVCCDRFLRVSARRRRRRRRRRLLHQIIIILILLLVLLILLLIVLAHIDPAPTQRDVDVATPSDPPACHLFSSAHWRAGFHDASGRRQSWFGPRAGRRGKRAESRGKRAVVDTAAHWHPPLTQCIAWCLARR